MIAVNAFIAKTIKWFLIVFGVATSMTLPYAIDINLLTPMLGGLVDYTPSSVPALRHWGIMIFGIGVLMVVAAFRPWLRFETMVFSTIEKSFMVYLFLTNLGQSWAIGYIIPFLVDSTIVAYSIVYFISDQGRPQRWIAGKPEHECRMKRTRAFAIDWRRSLPLEVLSLTRCRGEPKMNRTSSLAMASAADAALGFGRASNR